MNTARIAELLEPFLESSHLTPAQLDHISTYIDLLLRWNARVNLTAIRTPDEIITRHFGESIFAARYLLKREADTRPNALVLDVGSGAGFPGVPMKIWSPRVRITLIESNHKKVAFLREVIRALTLTDIDVFPNRAQDHPPASASLVTLRAVDRFADVLPTAARLLAPFGHLGLLITTPQLPEASHQLPALRWSLPIPIPLSTTRILAVAESRTTAQPTPRIDGTAEPSQ